MGVQQVYKQYNRGERKQFTNTSYRGGMFFTDAPIDDGFVKILLNYDVSTDGSTIKIRDAISTTPEGLYKQSESYKLSFQTSPVDDLIILGGNQVTRNNVEYKQIIVGVITLPHNSGKYVGNAWVLTCKIDNNIPQIKWHPLNDPTFGRRVFFTKPNVKGASIHDVPLTDSVYIKKHVGVFAFNGDYYYFTTDGTFMKTKFDSHQEKFVVEAITPYTLQQSETQNSLYNMLLKDPYDFKCTPVGASFIITGFAPFSRKEDGSSHELKIRPLKSIKYNYKLYYNYPAASTTEVYLHIEYSDYTYGNTWYPLLTNEAVVYQAGTNPFEFNGIEINHSFAMIRIFAVDKSLVDPEEDLIGIVGQQKLSDNALRKAVVFNASFNYAEKNTADSMLNVELKRYDLSNASGMSYWKNRIFLYGVIDRNTNMLENNVLIASDVNRPDWFPYTANADIFDEDIIYVQPMLDDLLVFTSHNLYSLTLTQDGLAWTKKHLQSNLNIAKHDLHLIQIVKNMVFFKSGNYYYMVVPTIKPTSSGLTVAPISGPMTLLFDNFQDSVDKLIDDVYNYGISSQTKRIRKSYFTSELVHYYNYLDYEDIHNNYVYEIIKHTAVNNSGGVVVYEKSKPYLLNFSVLYNTVTRTWRFYVHESERVVQPMFMNATGKGIYATLVNFQNEVCVQFLNYSNSSRDLYVKQGEDKPTLSALIKNWQYLDSGNKNIDANLKKTFREYQFTINNISKTGLMFYSGFFVDQEPRTYEIEYTQEELLDPDTGTVTVVVTGIPKGYNDSANGFTYTVLGFWKLNISRFPNTKNYKIRIPTQGKGFLGRTVLISYNESDYELLNHTAVYRTRNSR